MAAGFFAAALGAFFADCIPLYFYDKEKQVIGLAHSGWRGTCKKMGAVMIDEMAKKFGHRFACSEVKLEFGAVCDPNC